MDDDSPKEGQAGAKRAFKLLGKPMRLSERDSGVHRAVTREVQALSAGGGLHIMGAAGQAKFTRHLCHRAPHALGVGGQGCHVGAGRAHGLEVSDDAAQAGQLAPQRLFKGTGLRVRLTHLQGVADLQMQLQ